MMSLFIDWDVSPEIFSIGGFGIRYYSLFFALAFVFGYKIEERMFKAEGVPGPWLDKLWIYVAVATLAGARLGHCLFYEWSYFSAHPLEIVLPVRFQPEFKFTGFQGLASHGAAIGIIAGLWYYSRKVSKKSILWVLDRAVIPIALAGCFIRLGNLMNSEIVGSPTDMEWGFRFLRGKGIEDPGLPRHPAQLYEAFCYMVSFFILRRMFWKFKMQKMQGFIFGSFLVLIFAARFIIEYFKEVQETFELKMIAAYGINMGQLLSLPFILTGGFMLWFSYARWKKAGAPPAVEFRNVRKTS